MLDWKTKSKNPKVHTDWQGSWIQQWTNINCNSRYQLQKTKVFKSNSNKDVPDLYQESYITERNSTQLR